MFKNDDHEHGERSLERDSNIISSNGKTFKSSNKVYHLEKHKNLLKIINMYMKDYKKNHSKMKIAALLKNKNKIKKKNLYLYSSQKHKRKIRTNSTELKLPTIQDDDLPRIKGSNFTNRIFSARNNDEQKKNLNNKYNLNVTEYDSNHSESKNLIIPKIYNRRGNITLENSSNSSYSKRVLTTKVKKKKFSNNKQSSNIINIVNNVNGNQDKINNIGLKVNINRYDIKCYIPPKKNNIGNMNLNRNLEDYNNSSKSSEEYSMEVPIEKLKRMNSKNEMQVDIINFSKKSTKRITDKQKKKEDDLEIDKKIKRQILHKIKSLNNIYKTDMNGNRPMLDSDLDEEEDNRMKLRFVKRFLSKEINFDNDPKNDCKDIFDKIEINNLFLNGGQNFIRKKSKAIDYKKKGSNAMKNESQNFYSEMNDSGSECTEKISNELSFEGKDDSNIINNSNYRNDSNLKEYFKQNKKNIINENKIKRDNINKNKIKNDIINNQKDSSDDIENKSNYFNNVCENDSDTNIISDDENSIKSNQNNKKRKKLKDEQNYESLEILKRKKSKENLSENNNDEKTEILTTDNPKIKKKIKTKNKTINEEGEEISIVDQVSISHPIDGDLDPRCEEISSQSNEDSIKKSKIGKNKKTSKKKGFETTKNNLTEKKNKNIKKSLFSLLEKLKNGQILTTEEENHLMSSVIIKEIIEAMLASIFNQGETPLQCFKKFSIQEMLEKHTNDNVSNISLNSQEASDEETKEKKLKNIVEDNEILLNSSENSRRRKKIKNTNKNDTEYNSLENSCLNDSKGKMEYFSKAKRYIKKKKGDRPTSQRLMNKILIDFINPLDLKTGLMKQKNLLKAKTLNYINFKEADEFLINKNINNFNYNSSDFEEEPQVKDIKTLNLIKKAQMLKNLSNLEKTQRRIRSNWNTHLNIPNLEENIKLKFIDILSQKNQLKIKLEDMVIEQITSSLNDALNSDKNNKLSKMLIKLYREDISIIEIDKFDEMTNNFFLNPIIFNSKAKILQENKDYLNSVYFDIYNDIVNDIFNSKNSIFQFDQSEKGNSVLKNFQIRNKNLRTGIIDKDGIQREIIINKFEALKNNFHSKRFSIDDRQKWQLKDSSFCNIQENEDSRSNYERLGLANQTYINNILLRDFAFKEELKYIDDSRSEKVSDRTILDITSYVNESINLSSLVLNKKISLSQYKPTYNKTFKNLTKHFEDNLNNDKNPDINEGVNNEIIEELENGENFKKISEKISERKNSSEELNEKENNKAYDYSSGKKETSKIKKKRKTKKIKTSKNSSNRNNSKKTDEQNANNLELNKRDYDDPTVFIKNNYFNKDDIYLLRSPDNCQNIMSIKYFSKINNDYQKQIKSPVRNSLKNPEFDKVNLGENKKLLSSTPLTKENTLFKTLEIKSSQLQSFKDNSSEILKFYIKDGNFVKFKELFEKNKYLIDKFDENGDTLLNIAVKCNHYEIASYLLDHGADVNSQNKNLNAPLHYALSFKNFKIADLLLMKKADEELPNKKGYSPWQLLTLNENIDDV